MTDRVQFPGAEALDFKPIWAMKPAARRDEAQRQLSAAIDGTQYEDPETGAVGVEVTWTPNRFEKLRVERYVCHGFTDPIDSNSKEQLLLSRIGDPDVAWLTLALHMIGRIAPIVLEDKEG